MKKQQVKLEEDRILSKIEEHIMTSEVDGEMVLMNVNSGEYFGLDEISSNIWRLIDGTRTFNNVISELLQLYEVDEATCKKDCRPLFARLIKIHFIKFKD